MQEILLARQVAIVLPGNKIVDWRVLGYAITNSSTFDQCYQDVASQLYGFWRDRKGLEQARSRRHVHTMDVAHDAFWHLIHMHRNAQCTDKRDRVYSLLGLVPGGRNFTVDYNESEAELFWRAGEHFEAWNTPELVDILRIALLPSQDGDLRARSQADSTGVSPWPLIEALSGKPDLQVRIPVRHVWSTASFARRIIKSVKCKFEDCYDAPRIPCAHSDLLLCTNEQSFPPSEHGCVHAIAHPLDKPAAERFELHLVAHHRSSTVSTVLPPTALQVLDEGTDAWVSVLTWSSLRKALRRSDLDRANYVKLLVPAKYAVWIWFGVHPSHLEHAWIDHATELPSASTLR